MPSTANIETVVSKILELQNQVSKSRSLLVGLSGIDGSGKGYLANQIVPRLWQRSIHAVTINIDGWLNLPQVRFNRHQPARHFYDFAIRFEEMFQQLILPLRNSRSHRVIAEFVTEVSTQFEKHCYEFNDVDVIVLEGNFLFRSPHVSHFDLKIWIDCSFETALARALSRQQEKLSLAETIRAYETIYFPAQRLHFRRDCPREQADLILKNEEQLGISSRRLAAVPNHSAKTL